MPVLMKDGLRSHTAGARLIELSERDLYRDLLGVVSEARAILEMAQSVAAEEGCKVRLDADTKALIPKAVEALMDINAECGS